jgi:hypothetical protein
MPFDPGDDFIIITVTSSPAVIVCRKCGSRFPMSTRQPELDLHEAACTTDPRELERMVGL